MANTLSEALLVLTSWNTGSDLTSQPTRTLVKDFCENTLKSDKVSKLYCAVLDVEVSEDQKQDAESVGVTLIPATRSKWADADEDPPGVNWLINHNMYYPKLNILQGVKHVVSFSSNTKNAAAAIHESLFPNAKLHQLAVPTPPGVVFAFDAWSKDACGLTGYHRAIIQDFIARKAESGEYPKAYSTVIDVELSEDQIEDAEKCGVTLIKAQRKKGVDEMPNRNWLIYHKSLFPDLQKLKNIKYVVGYAPKTGWAAIEIWKTLFSAAKLVLINHVCEEKNCLLVKDEFPDLEQQMLQMASHADLLFSIGPCIYDYFQRAYRAEIRGRKLSDIPHKEILPKPRQKFFDNKSPEIENDAHTGSILTYGQLNTEEALKRCDTIAASIGSAANKYNNLESKKLEWKIYGVSEQAFKGKKDFLEKQTKSSHVTIKAYKHDPADTLLQSLQQSDLCLPPSCYTDYSFEGLEAMAAGLPTTVQDDSHIAAMIDKHFEEHKYYCVVRNGTENLTLEIIEKLKKSNVAVQQAKLLKKDLAASNAVTGSLAEFASSLTDEDAETQNSDNNGLHPRTSTTQNKETQALHPAMSNTEDFDSSDTTEGQHQIIVTEETKTSETKGVPAEISETKFMKATDEITETQNSKETTAAVQSGMTGKEDMNKNRRGENRKSLGFKKSGQGESEAMKPKIKKIGSRSSKPGTISPQSGATESNNAIEDIQSKFERERETLESQVKKAKEEKATLEERCKELTQKLESTEQSLVSQRIGTSVSQKTLQSELEKKKKLITRLEVKVGELEVKVGELEHKLEQSEQRKSEEKAMADIHSKMERASLESQLKEAKEEKGTLEERCKKLTQKLESTEQSLVSQRIGNRVEREKLQSELIENQKLIRELENTVEELYLTLEQPELNKPEEEDPTIMPQQLPQHHHEMSTGHMMQASAATGPPTSPVVYSQAQQMPYPTAQPHTQRTIMGQMRPQHVQYQPNILYTQKPQMYIPPPQGQFTSPYYQGQNPIPQEIQTSATQVYAPTLMPQQPPQHHHQMSAGHMMQASTATGPPTSLVVYPKAQQMPYPTAQSHTQGTIMGQMRPQHVQYQPNIQYTQKPQMYIPSPQGQFTSPYYQGQNPIPQEIQTSATQVYAPTLMPQQPPQHQHEMFAGHMMQASAATGPPTSPVVYSKAQQMPYPTAQPRTLGTIMVQMRPQHVPVQYQPNILYTQKPQMYIPPPQGQFTSPYYQGQNPIPQEIQTSATQVYAPTLMPQQPPQHQHEMFAGHMMQAFPATGPPTSPVVYSQSQQMPYPTAQLHTQGTIMGQMILQHMQYQPSMQMTGQ